MCTVWVKDICQTPIPGCQINHPLSSFIIYASNLLIV